MLLLTNSKTFQHVGNNICKDYTKSRNAVSFPKHQQYIEIINTNSMKRLKIKFESQLSNFLLITPNEVIPHPEVHGNFLSAFNSCVRPNKSNQMRDAQLVEKSNQFLRLVKHFVTQKTCGAGSMVYMRPFTLNDVIERNIRVKNVW